MATDQNQAEQAEQNPAAAHQGEQGPSRPVIAVGEVYAIESYTHWSDRPDYELDLDEGIFESREAAQARVDQLNLAEFETARSNLTKTNATRAAAAERQRAEHEALRAAGLRDGEWVMPPEFTPLTMARLWRLPPYRVAEDPTTVYGFAAATDPDQTDTEQADTRQDARRAAGQELMLALADELLAIKGRDDCAALTQGGAGRCIEPATALAWEGGDLTAVCEHHAQLAERRAATLIHPTGASQ